MKKIIKLILLIMLIIPLTVNADMAAPYMEKYKAYVTKVEGVDYYSRSWENNKIVLTKVGTLSYNEEITITYEEEIGKTVYASFEMDNETYYVKIDEILAKNASYSISNAAECYESEYSCKNKEYIVLSEDGIKMHTGPANGYEVIGETIPKGTILKFTHYQGDSAWYYTEYKGVKGWVSALYGTIGKKENKKVMNIIELNIYETPSGENRKVLGIINANTEVIAEYSTDAWSSEYLINYNGITGYINTWDTAVYQEDETIVLEKDSKMIDIISYNANEKILIEKINKGTKIITNYRWADAGSDFAYTTINGKTGWVCLYGCDENFNENQGTITPPIIYTTTITTTTTTNKIVVETNKSISGNEIVVLCVGAAIIIALTATVTVILVNRKNKKTTNNPEMNNNISNDDNNLKQDTNKKE